MEANVGIKDAVFGVRWRVQEYEAALLEGDAYSEASKEAWYNVKEELDRLYQVTVGGSDKILRKGENHSFN